MFHTTISAWVEQLPVSFQQNYRQWCISDNGSRAKRWGSEAGEYQHHDELGDILQRTVDEQKNGTRSSGVKLECPIPIKRFF